MINKKSIYILLPIVLVLWGYIAWQIFQHIKVPDVVEIPFISTSKREIEKEELIPYVLNLNYKDPFFKVAGEGLAPEIDTNNDLELIVTDDNLIIEDWPYMIYNGWIESQKKTVGIFQIDNNQYLVCEGEEYNSIYIEKLYQDSIFVRKNGKCRIIKK